ncbi:MAG: AAA family ATPase, partial [Muribaculaceae bacterium]
MIKVITGIRRCGKSFLLFDIFADYLRQEGTLPEHIVSVNLEDYKNISLRNPNTIYQYLEDKIVDDDMYYILIDEIQLLDKFEDVLNGFLRRRNVDIYVTGSNAKMLSKDVITEFRGRGQEIKVYPLSFREYLSAFKGSQQLALNEYMLYGGLPQILS